MKKYVHNKLNLKSKKARKVKGITQNGMHKPKKN